MLKTKTAKELGISAPVCASRDGLCAGRRARQPADGADRPARQAGGLFRRQVAHHRFRAVERAQFRHPPHRGGDAVQGAQPDPPPAARLELLPARAQREFRHPAGLAARLRDDVVSRHGRRGLSEHRHHRELRARSSWSSSPATTSTRWTTRRCCSSTSSPAPTSRSAASRPRSRRPRASASCMSTRTTAIIEFLEKPKNPPPMPGKPDVALCSMGIYVFDTKFLIEQLEARRRRPEFEPRFRQGHHPLSRQERQSGRASFLALLRALERGGADLLARRRHGRRLLGGQHRSDRRRARPRSLRPRLADLDLWRDHAAGKFVHDVDGRRGSRSPRCLRRLHRLGLVDLALAAVHRLRVHSYSTVHEAVILPYVRIGRGCGCNKVVIDRGVRIPDGLVVGEDPELDAKRFRRTETGVTLITQPMIDKLAQLSELQSSLRSPRRRSRSSRPGGLADVAGALPARAAARRRRDAHAAAGLSRRHGQARQTPRPSTTMPTCSAARRASLPARAAGLDLFVLDAPHLFDRPGNPYLGPDGRDWPDNALSLRRAGARRRRSRQRRVGAFRAATSSHAHDWQAALAPAYLHYDGGPRPGTVMTIHNIAFQGHFSGLDLLGALGLPASAMTIDGVEYFGGIGFLKAGLLLADRITTVSPTYAREILTPEFGMALDGLLRTRAAVVEGIVNGIDDESGIRRPTPTLAQTYSALRLDRRAAQQDGAADANSAWRASADRAAVRRRVAADQPEGARPAARRLPGSRRARRPARAARHRRAGARAGLRRRGGGASERGRLRDRLRRDARPSDPGRRATSSSCRRASSPAA